MLRSGHVRDEPPDEKSAIGSLIGLMLKSFVLRR